MSSPNGAAQLEDVLVGEYAAVYAYGTIGAALPADEPAARNALADHRRARDWLRTRITALGATAPEPAPAYDVGPFDSTEDARAAAAELENALVPRWARAAPGVKGPDRVFCANQAQYCATRAVTWGSPSAAFPGTIAPQSSQSPQPRTTPTT